MKRLNHILSMGGSEMMQGERGQVVVATAIALVFFALMGALSIDVGIYVNGRRDAQNVVDKAAIAGALELTLEVGHADTDSAKAVARANEWAANNGISPADPGAALTVQVVQTCYSAADAMPTGVEVSLRRNVSSIFLGFVPGMANWEVSATALACAGRPGEAYDFFPMALSRIGGSCFQLVGGVYEPRLGERCMIYTSTVDTGETGLLAFDSPPSCVSSNPSAPTTILEDNVQDGVHVTCSIGNEVVAKQGSVKVPFLRALKARLTTEGSCQANYLANGGTVGILQASTAALNARVSVPLAGPVDTNNYVDDLYEVWAYKNDPDAHPAAGLVAYDCNPAVSGLQTSPRSMQLIIVNDWANPDGANNHHVVQGFARVYFEGCQSGTTFYRRCGVGTPMPSGADYSVYVRLVEQLNTQSVNLGLGAGVGDIEVFLKR